jgi:hypothetical protein
MFKNRSLLVLGVFGILLVSLSLVSFRTNASLSNRAPANDYFQRHPNWTGLASAPVAAYSDYAERHPELSKLASLGQGASDYFERHPELIPAAKSDVDLTDYYFRHINNRSLP